MFVVIFISLVSGKKEMEKNCYSFHAINSLFSLSLLQKCEINSNELNSITKKGRFNSLCIKYANVGQCYFRQNVAVLLLLLQELCLYQQDEKKQTNTKQRESVQITSNKQQQEAFFFRVRVCVCFAKLYNGIFGMSERIQK